MAELSATVTGARGAKYYISCSYQLMPSQCGMRIVTDLRAYCGERYFDRPVLGCRVPKTVLQGIVRMLLDQGVTGKILYTTARHQRALENTLPKLGFVPIGTPVQNPNYPGYPAHTVRVWELNVAENIRELQAFINER